MDHISLHTPGISKKKKWRPPQNFKAKRYFSLEPSDNDPISGSELVMMKKTNTDQTDVTKKLLNLVSKLPNVNANSEKQFVVNGNVIEVSKNAESSLKMKSSPTSQKNEEIGSKDDVWKKKMKTEEPKQRKNINVKKDSKLHLKQTLKADGHKNVIKEKSKKPFVNDVSLSKNTDYISQDSSVGMKELMQDSAYKNGNQFEIKIKKHNFSPEKKTNENISVKDKTEPKISETAKLYDAASVFESSKTLSKHRNIAKGKCILTGVKNLSLRHKSETKISDRSVSVTYNEGNIFQTLSDEDIPDKKLSQNGVFSETRQEKRISGEWNVQNCDEPPKKKITPKSSQRCKTRKQFTANNISEDARMDNSRSEQTQQTNYVEKERIFETEMEDSPSLLRISGNNKTEEFIKETCNSQPIIVEMSGVHNVPSNPIHHKESNLKKKNEAPLFNSKSNVSWRPSKTCDTENWEVQYANTDNFPGIENQNFGNVNEKLTPEFEESETSLTKSDTYLVGESNFENSCNMYHLFDISDSEAVLVLPPLYILFFKGALKMKVLVGKITVLGHEISCTSQKYTVYSPFGVSLPGLQACAKQDESVSKENYWQQVANSLNQLNKEKAWIQEKILYEVPEFSSIILLEQVSETLLSFLGKYLPILRFPSAMAMSRPGEDASGTLRVLFVDPKSTVDKLYREPSAWDSLIQFLLKRESDKIRVMACGGKGVGKSTFLRFLSNKTLSKHKQVLYIDFDPGQSEFTIPGCVSAVIVKNPLLGPNFTHVTCPERMIYVGEVDITRCSTHYLQCVKDLFYWCLAQPHLFLMPWLINTMGFVRGLGVELMVTIIKMVNPSDVIQINSSLPKRNYQFPLNRESVQDYVSSVQSFSHKKEKDLSYAFHLVPSAAESPTSRNSPWGVQANVARETIIMSYFSQVVAPPTYSLLEIAPYKFLFSGLKLCVAHEKKIRFCDYLSAMNGNLVALCDAKNVPSLKPNDPGYPEIIVKPPICQCVGFGIVRGVDLEKKAFFIITPIEPRKLKIVDCLILGSVHLPDSVYTYQDEARGTIPYVVEGDLLPLGHEVRAAKPVAKLKQRY